MAYAMQDRRCELRLVDDLGVAVQVLPEDGRPPSPSSGTIFHLTRDISEGGLQFRHHEELPLNSLLKIHVALKLPLMSITQYGRVRWVQPAPERHACDIGVQFTDTPEVDRQIWHHYLTRFRQATPA